MSAIVSPYSSSSAVPKWEFNRRGGKGEGGGRMGKKGKGSESPSRRPFPSFSHTEKNNSFATGWLFVALTFPRYSRLPCLLTAKSSGGLESARAESLDARFLTSLFFFFFLFATVTVTQLFPRGSFCNRLFFFFLFPFFHASPMLSS